MRSEFSFTGWLKAYWKRMESMLDRVTEEALDDYRARLEEELRRNAAKGGARGLHVRSANLIGNIRVTRLGRTSGVQVAMPRYGFINNTGAVITAKDGGYLTFYIPGVGWRKSRKVVIPAKHWIDDAQSAADGAWPAMVARAVGRVVSRD